MGQTLGGDGVNELFGVRGNVDRVGLATADPPIRFNPWPKLAPPTLIVLNLGEAFLSLTGLPFLCLSPAPRLWLALSPYLQKLLSLPDDMT